MKNGLKIPIFENEYFSERKHKRKIFKKNVGLIGVVVCRPLKRMQNPTCKNISQPKLNAR